MRSHRVSSPLWNKRRPVPTVSANKANNSGTLSHVLRLRGRHSTSYISRQESVRDVPARKRERSTHHLVLSEDDPVPRLVWRGQDYFPGGAAVPGEKRPVPGLVRKGQDD